MPGNQQHTFPWIIILLATALWAQESLIESLYEQAEEADTEVIERLERLAKNPPDLNRASKDRLRDFPLFSDPTLRRIIEMRPFVSWKDFKTRVDPDDMIMRWIEEYFTISPPENPAVRNLSCAIRERFQDTFPRARGFRESIYEGAPGKNYHRIRVFTDQIDAGLLIERDPGEPRWNDHQVGHLGLALSQHLRIVAGNFRMESGLGLVFGSPYGTGKGADPLGPALTPAQRLRGYVAADESRAFLGGACQWRRGPFSAVMLHSQARRDGATDDSLIQSLPTSGLHRTRTESDRRLNIKETLVGARIALTSSQGMIGLSGWHNAYSMPVAAPDPERNRFGFSGDRNHVIGCDWTLRMRDIEWSGEAAVSKSGGRGCITHLIIRNPAASSVMLFRHFDPGFHNPHAQGFGYGDPRNESGFYWGVRSRLSDRTRLNLYFDAMKTPWRSWFNTMPVSGSDLLMHLEHKVHSHLILTGRWRIKQNEHTATAKTGRGREFAILQSRKSTLWRIELMYQPEARVRLRSRFEQIRLHDESAEGDWFLAGGNESGLLFFQDLRIHFARKSQLTGRWMTWQTDSYDSRIYEFENDLPGAFTNRALYGQGARWYVLVKWHPKHWIVGSMKYGWTYHDGVASWGGGYDERPGDVIRDFGLQVDISIP